MEERLTRKTKMITLKDLVAIQQLSGATDIELIYKWFTENNQESEALELIPKLAKSQFDKINNKYHYVESWLPCMQLDNRVKDIEVRNHLNFLMRVGLLDVDLTFYKDQYEWAKANIPKMEVPQIFFGPTLNYLAKYDIYFKGREHLGLKQH